MFVFLIATFSNLGTVYYYQKRYEKALEMYQTALQIQEAVNAVAARSTENLAGFVQQFRASRFLFDYAATSRSKANC